ncbi:hypothetical protein CBR_g31862 [Chara braunii]|uniref:Uncharacterized protein n=1 Tax=Chara braunii TaxID=69332 RepID=A0A388LFV8_CHABU|nr:hypothetical protein CBR_g31862 [Chara braunii]|eukprot:GBG81189.1 hypothetical protein CBR_g31862 [Chara braunii]
MDPEVWELYRAGGALALVGKELFMPLCFPSLRLVRAYVRDCTNPLEEDPYKLVFTMTNSGICNPVPLHLLRTSLPHQYPQPPYQPQISSELPFAISFDPQNLAKEDSVQASTSRKNPVSWEDVELLQGRLHLKIQMHQADLNQVRGIFDRVITTLDKSRAAQEEVKSLQLIFDQPPWRRHIAIMIRANQIELNYKHFEKGKPAASAFKNALAGLAEELCDKRCPEDAKTMLKTLELDTAVLALSKINKEWDEQENKAAIRSGYPYEVIPSDSSDLWRLCLGGARDDPVVVMTGVRLTRRRTDGRRLGAGLGAGKEQLRVRATSAGVRRLRCECADLATSLCIRGTAAFVWTD